MPILISNRSSTFGDATCSEGQIATSKYVLAQFRDDADLDWVSRLRSAVPIDELKFEAFKEQRPKIRKDRELWSKVEKGVGQAAIIVIDPQPHRNAIQFRFESEGRESGIDFDENDLTKECAVAVLGNTPIAYLPVHLEYMMFPTRPSQVATLYDFTPQHIQRQIGDSLRTAKVLAARAFAAFDVPSISDHSSNLNSAFQSPLSNLILREVLATNRVFDHEDPKSVKVLNTAATLIADRLDVEFVDGCGFPLASEADSKSVDHIQAADMAAGWARDTIDTVGTIALGNLFERVWLNGQRLK